MKQANISSQFIASLNEFQRREFEKSLQNYSKLLKQSISTTNGIITNQSLAIKQGFLAETHHAISYNIEATAKGELNYKADLSDSPTDPIKDITITSPAGREIHYQVKFYQNGEKTAKAFNHSRYNQVDGKIVPTDQLNEAKQASHCEALRNQNIRPEVSKNYKHTEKTLDDTIYSKDRLDIRSNPLHKKGKGGSEDLTERTEQGERVEYERTKRVKQEFNSMQYKNAVKYGATSSFILSTGKELIKVMSSDKSLTEEECKEIAMNIFKDTTKGASQALLATGIQHLGSNLAKTTTNEMIKGLGQNLAKGNIASQTAVFVPKLIKNLFDYSNDKIDGVEFAESMTNSGINICTNSLGYTGGIALAPILGRIIPSSVANIAVLGTSLGSLGPIACGIVGAMVVSMLANAYVGHFKNKGQEIAMKDIQEGMDLLKLGQMNLATYTDKVGSMSDLEFSWSDILPFSGPFTIWGEYSARKQQLKTIQQEIQTKRGQLREQEMQAMYALASYYKTELMRIEDHYNELKTQVTKQANKHLENIEIDLERHLQLQFALFQSGRTKRLKDFRTKKYETQKQELIEKKAKFYEQEIKQLKEQFFNQKDENSKRFSMVLNQRLNDVLPQITPYDQAYNFMQGKK